jgi:hypothetical protein
MKTLTGNKKAGSAGAALAVILSAGLLNGCGYGSWVQINDGATATTDATLSLTLHAEDDDGVRAYLVREGSPAEVPAAPAAGDSGWMTIPPAQQSTEFDTEVPQPLADVSGGTEPASGKKTIYVWFKDGYGNVSDPVSDSITYGSTGGGEVCTTPGYGC